MKWKRTKSGKFDAGLRKQQLRHKISSTNKKDADTVKSEPSIVVKSFYSPVTQLNISLNNTTDCCESSPKAEVDGKKSNVNNNELIIEAGSMSRSYIESNTNTSPDIETTIANVNMTDRIPPNTASLPPVVDYASITAQEFANQYILLEVSDVNNAPTIIKQPLTTSSVTSNTGTDIMSLQEPDFVERFIAERQPLTTSSVTSNTGADIMSLHEPDFVERFIAENDFCSESSNISNCSKACMVHTLLQNKETENDSAIICGSYAFTKTDDSSVMQSTKKTAEAGLMYQLSAKDLDSYFGNTDSESSVPAASYELSAKDLDSYFGNAESNVSPPTPDCRHISEDLPDIHVNIERFLSSSSV